MPHYRDHQFAQRFHYWQSFSWLLACSFLFNNTTSAQQPPPDATWMADAALDAAQSITDVGLGAIQGVVVRDGKVYAYGDVFQAKPRIGVIREYNELLEPTGRGVWLRHGRKPLIVHPAGLTWHKRWGTLLGDTIKTADPARSRAVIYRLDWEKAWINGDLDEAILNVIEDDAAINGCRPEFVKVAGRTLLATADYGEVVGSFWRPLSQHGFHATLSYQYLTRNTKGKQHRH